MLRLLFCHGLHFCRRLFSQGRPGQRLARALNQAGPSFIKLGQALSTRADILGDELSEDLSELQDRLPPFSGAEARAIIEDEFGDALEDLFQEFDDEAVAAACVGHFQQQSIFTLQQLQCDFLLSGRHPTFDFLVQYELIVEPDLNAVVAA